MKRIVLGMTLAGLLAGCAWRTQIPQGTVSTCKIDFDKSYEIDRSHKIEGTDRAHSLWLLSLGSPDATEAIKTTIEDANENNKRKVVGLADTEVKFRVLWLWYYGQRWYTVEGYPIYEK